MVTRIENTGSDGLEFLPHIFDNMQRKCDYDCEDAVVMQCTSHLCSAQLQHFQRVSDIWLPGMLHHDILMPLELDTLQ